MGRWKLPSAPTGHATRLGTDFVMERFGPGGIKWGLRYSEDGPKVTVVTPSGELQGLAYQPLNVIPQGNGGSAGPSYIATFRELDRTTRIWHDGRWLPNIPYADALDIAGNGTAISKSVNGNRAPVYLNGKWMNLDRTAPGIPQTSVVHADTELLDISPEGWILGK